MARIAAACLVLLHAAAPAASGVQEHPRTDPDAAEPAATLVGYWEAAQRSLGGIGSSMWIRDDGTVRTCMGVLWDTVYRLDGDQLTVGDDEVTCTVGFDGDRLMLFGTGVDKTLTRLPGTAGQTGSILGAWSHPSLGMTYEAYYPDGSYVFRIPFDFTIEEAPYVVIDDVFRLWDGFVARDLSFVLDEGRLLLTKPEGESIEYVRMGDAPWFPLEPLSEEEREARGSNLDSHRETTAERLAFDWKKALAGIAAAERYGGLELVPQRGLAPLMQDHVSGLWEFWHPESGERPQLDRETRWWVMDGAAGMVFVLIPGDAAQGIAPFFLSKYELQAGQWQRLSRDATDSPPEVPWSLASEGESLVQETLSRFGLTLPTEEQWEYAARGRTRTPWWTGAEAKSLIGAANLGDAAYGRQAPGGAGFVDWLDDGHAHCAPVGSYRPNFFGLFDVHGNVAELCLTFDPSRSFVYRGGSFVSLPEAATFLTREGPPEAGTRGVRAVRAVE